MYDSKRISYAIMLAVTFLVTKDVYSNKSHNNIVRNEHGY
jgi:hypothetical protein